MARFNRRRFLQTTGLASVATSAAKPRPDDPGKRPNILLIVGDNMQWGTIANRSECRTPNINRLASEGLLFNRSYTTAAVCSPARNALLTGAFNWGFGTYNQPDNSSAISTDPFPDIVTYAQRLSAAGYRLGYNGKWHTSTKRSPLDFGYHEIGAPDRYRRDLANLPDKLGLKRPGEAEVRVPVKTISWPGSKPFGLWGYTECEEEETLWAETADAGSDMIRRLSPSSSPWMIEVHFPERSRGWPLRSYLERYDPRDIAVSPNFHDTFDGKPGLQKRDAETYGDMSEADYQQGRAHYYASFEQLDAQVGRLLDTLDESGEAHNTLVIFTADHGAPYGSHHMWTPNFAPYEELYRIPMVVRWPGHTPPGAECNSLVQLHDLGHTFVDVLGLDPLPHRHGVSLAPLFENPNREEWRDMIFAPWYGQNFPLIHRMVITGQYKYVFNGYDYDECYDLLADPYELRNIAYEKSTSAEVGDMRARLYELMNRFRDPFGENATDPGNPRFLAQRYLPQGRRL